MQVQQIQKSLAGGRPQGQGQGRLTPGGSVAMAAGVGRQRPASLSQLPSRSNSLEQSLHQQHQQLKQQHLQQQQLQQQQQQQQMQQLQNMQGQKSPGFVQSPGASMRGGGNFTFPTQQRMPGGYNRMSPRATPSPSMSGSFSGFNAPRTPSPMMSPSAGESCYWIVASLQDL